MNHLPIPLEFVGGPFDGHRQSVPGPVDELTETLALPINQNVFQMLSGKSSGPARPALRIALYDLRIENRVCRYYFRAICPAAELHLEDWQV